MSHVRPLLDAEVERAFGCAIGREYCFLTDCVTIGFGEWKSWSDIYSDYQERIGKVVATQRRDVSVDCGWWVRFMHVGGYLYARFNSERASIMDIWAKESGFESYDYWDNSDCPKEFTNAQWAKRGRDWDKAYEAGWISEENMLMPFVYMETKYLPTVEERAKLVAYLLWVQDKPCESGSQAVGLMDKWKAWEGRLAYIKDIESRLIIMDEAYVSENRFKS
jgi:hypothetical protein